MTSTQLYARLLAQVQAHWRVYVFAILGMLLSAATEVALPASRDDMIAGMPPYRRFSKSQPGTAEFFGDKHRFEHWYLDNQVYFNVKADDLGQNTYDVR